MRRDIDAIEFGAIAAANGFLRLRLGQRGSCGLYPEWNGAGYQHALKHVGKAP